MRHSAAEDHEIPAFEDRGPEGAALRLSGALDLVRVTAIWDPVLEAAEDAAGRDLVIEAGDLEALDAAGVGLLAELHRRQKESGGKLEIRGLASDLSSLLETLQYEKLGQERAPKKPVLNIPEEIGVLTVDFWKSSLDGVTFLGEATVGLLVAIVRPRGVRWKDALVAAEKSGVNALPIVTLVGLLVGLIIAYQSSDQLRDYGGDNLLGGMVSVVMARELGPLMAAIILAARTGSAYAAEIGTMKVNEEIDALTTMGLDPLRFLAVPRMIAGMIMTPLLTIFAILGGIVGGGIVALGTLDQTAPFFVETALDWTDLEDLLGGLLKAVVFGILIAAVGCHRGLRTSGGSSGVGDAATAAVVNSIVLIIVVDGIFAVVFFTLGI